jgi:hypothetical protein
MWEILVAASETIGFALENVYVDVQIPTREGGLHLGSSL